MPELSQQITVRHEDGSTSQITFVGIPGEPFQTHGGCCWIDAPPESENEDEGDVQ